MPVILWGITHMIATLNGKVLEKLDQAIVLGVSGIGYRVRLPEPVLAELRLGDDFFCYTHLSVRETEWNLFGFKTRNDMKLFELLLTVQKVGPKAALAALSAMEPHMLAAAIVGEQPEMLTHIPGIGKKTAQRIVLDLKGKVDDYATGTIATSRTNDVDAISALIALGYSAAEAQDAIKTLDPSLSLEEKIWASLQRLSG